MSVLAVSGSRRPPQPRTPAISNTQLAMVAVIVSEFMLFAGLIGAVVCLVTIPFVPVGMSILCAAVAVLVGIRPDPEPDEA